MARILPETPAHPLDALTAEEYWTVFEVLKASGRVDPQTRYPAINLQESPAPAATDGGRSNRTR